MVTIRPASRRGRLTHQIKLRRPVSLQFCVLGAGLFQPELYGEISAARGGCDTRAGLWRDARGVGTAVVPFLPAHRAIGGRCPWSGGDGGRRPRRVGLRKQIVGDVTALRRIGEMNA
jgi:hypothetical protein